MSQVPSAERPPLVRRPVFWLLLIAAVLVVVIAVVLGFALGAPRGGDAATMAAPTSAPRATTDAATAPATETASPADQTGVVIPATCDGIYTRDWSGDLAPRVLNPAWVSDPARGFKRYGSNDVGLVTMLEATTRLECNWVPEGGATHLFLVTGVAQLTPEQQGSILDHLATTDMDCYDESGGTRCVIEREESETWGESHFVRDGIWIATRWGVSGPSGYTADIVAAIFG
ncbi:hypothetical protein [Agromyces sp. Soil535]|uniref:hypothetical protein n=1 Tax=Agromyces sp. Soil535 TaxID=1736390 RepID=UPI0012E35938|nr:hypothetical protein [Agromyces sp. Soil535]